jgi:hypothetical protein
VQLFTQKYTSNAPTQQTMHLWIAPYRKAHTLYRKNTKPAYAVVVLDSVAAFSCVFGADFSFFFSALVGVAMPSTCLPRYSPVTGSAKCLRRTPVGVFVAVGTAARWCERRCFVLLWLNFIRTDICSQYSAVFKKSKRHYVHACIHHISAHHHCNSLSRMPLIVLCLQQGLQNQAQ